MLSFILTIVSGILLIYCCVKQLLIIWDSRINEKDFNRAMELIQERLEAKELLNEPSATAFGKASTLIYPDNQGFLTCMECKSILKSANI